MPIISVTTSFQGEVGVLPARAAIQTSDTIAQVTTPGYLNKIVQNGTSFPMPCIVEVSTIASVGAQPQVGWYQLSHVAGNWSLIASSDLPQVPFIVAGNIQAGSSGIAGTLASFPATAAKGALILAAVANTGNTNVTISNVAHGQATLYSIPDIGAPTGGFVVSTTNARIKFVTAAAAAGGAAAQSFSDAYCTSGSIVIGNWVTQANAASVLKIVPGNGSFVVTSSADAGAGTFSYQIIK